MISVRPAHSEDACALSELAEVTFRATFAPTNTREDLDLHCLNSYSEAIQLAEILDRTTITLVAEAGQNLIGYAQLHWGNPPGCVKGRNVGEIRRLYVHNQWHGKGVAQLLMERCLGEIEARDSDVAWLGVWEHNPRAIRFYSKFGFKEAGEHVFKLGNDPQRDIVMVRNV